MTGEKKVRGSVAVHNIISFLINFHVNYFKTFVYRFPGCFSLLFYPDVIYYDLFMQRIK